MLKHTQLFSVTTLLLFPIHFANADQLFSMDDITQSLQTEYQQQLRQPKARSKPISKSRVKAKRQPAPAYLPPVQLPEKVAISGSDSLFGAATHGNVNLIGKLLRQGVNINAANSERETALHMAAANGRYSAVIYLINHGANLHFRTIKNWLPIHHATRFRHANIANYLIQKGSSPHARTSDGLSAIDMARSTGDQRLLGIFGVK